MAPEVDTEAVALDRETVDALVAHAWSDHPYEVCGLLGIADEGTITRFPITNAERSMTNYVMDGRELLHAMRTIEDEDWRLVIYHSHTHTEAYPSRTDVELAAYPDAVYLIVSLQDRDAPEIRGFRILDGTIHEVPVLQGAG
ncbi:MAG: M67 family metallopeptidase [Nitriliruptorales bacterium]